MNIKTLCLTGALLLTGINICAQKKKEVINDSNTPLHLLQPAYKVPYKELTTTDIKTDISRLLHYRQTSTAYSSIMIRRLLPALLVKRPER